jgi:DNA-binding Lrp family transcriptional regulator
MDAFVFLRVETGELTRVLAALSTTQGVRRAVAVIGDWDILLHTEGPDLETIASVVLSELHSTPGVVRTMTAPVVPADRVSITGLGGPKLPSVVEGACFVRIKAEPGSTPGLVERFAALSGVAGVAVIAGEWDLLVSIPEPWEVASGVILNQIQSIPGVLATNTLPSLRSDDPDDPLSVWG